MIRSIRHEKFEDNYFTKNRKLKIEEYDNEGKLIDVIELSQKDFWEFYMYKNNGYSCIDVARKSDREYFSGERLELAKKIITIAYKEYFSINTIKKIEKLFEQYTTNQIKFALEFKDYFYGVSKYRFIGEDEKFICKLDFTQVLEYLKSKGGFWYAVDSNGRKGMAYLNHPTKKQIRYQKSKNKMVIVFLNFEDMKEYSIIDDKLK